jgi:hypothetical protein
VVRLAEDPWLVRYAADGQASPLSLQAGLEWALAFVVAKDGSFYVAGGTNVGTAGAGVRVDHLSPVGVLLASNDLRTDGGLTTFQALSLGPDDKVYLLGESASSRSLITLTAEGGFGSALMLPAVASNQDGQHVLDAPSSMAIGPNGSITLQGGSDALWVQHVEMLGNTPTTAWWQTLADNFARASVYAGGVAAAEDGGWFVGVGTGWTNASSLLGYYQRTVVHFTNDGRTLWGSGDYFEPLQISEPSVMRHARICPLADSVLLATLVPATPRNRDDKLLDASEPSATVARYTKNGVLAQSLALPGVIDLVPVGPTSAVFLGADAKITRLDLQALNPAPAATGDVCTAAADCVSGACCASPSSMFKSECGAAAKCAQGDLCTDDSTCAGTCVKGSTAGSQGFCSTACAASSDCPKNSFCVGTNCLATCNAATDCPHQGTSCVPVANTESVMVTVCKPD